MNLVVVSHRGPGGNGGLAPTLDWALRTQGGTWIASDGQDRPYRLVHVPLDEREQREYYCGFANSALWPLCHTLIERASFRPEEWATYRAVNRRFARAAAEVSPPGALVWVHDYQLALVPRLLRQLRPDVAIAFFWHIPWPEAGIWRLCPPWRKLVRGILSADLIGFHTRLYRANFRSVAGRAPQARVLPLGVDFEHIARLAAARTTARHGARLARTLGLQGQIVAVGVDRLDYTKGILQRMDALTTFFDRWPEFRGRLTFVQVAAPSRSDVPAYQSLRGAVRRAAQELNARFGSGAWRPLRLLDRRVGFRTVVALYRLAAFALVGPLFDGMNLVAKEYVAAQVDGRGVLLLSRMAGAAEQLPEAVRVNPLDPDGMARAMRRAATMPPDEQERRMRALRARVAGEDARHWLAANLWALYELRRPGPARLRLHAPLATMQRPPRKTLYSAP